MERRRFRPSPRSRRLLHTLGLLLAAVAPLAFAACGEPAVERSQSPAVLAASVAPTVKASTGILVDRATGRVLWKKSPDTRRAPASLTKVMTAIIVLQKVKNLDSSCVAPKVVSKNLVNEIGLRPGDRITVRNALNATLVKSANDACITLACKVAGSEAAFVKMMNNKARALGLDDTHFKNSHGLPVSGHYMSADDLARLGRYVMGNSTFRSICAKKKATIKWTGHSLVVESRNRLLNYDWAYGIKTGATGASGMCLLGAGTYSLRPLILVTMNEPTRNQEERDAVAMFAWGDAQYERRTIVAARDLVTTLPLPDGSEVRAVAASSLTKVVRRVASIQIALSAPAPAGLPEAGVKVGTVTYRADGIKLGTVDLLADGPVVVAPSPSGS